VEREFNTRLTFQLVKTGLSKLVRLPAILNFMIWAVTLQVYSQNPPGLGVQVSGGYAQLSITGYVGTACMIQWVTNLSQTNSWQCLTNLTLTNSLSRVVDTVPPTAQRFYRAFSPSKMVWIPPGRFVMGSPTNEALRYLDETQHPVTLTGGFYMGKYAVTQGDYLALIGSNPSWFDQSLSQPVDSVRWIDATNYCARLTEQERAAGRLPAGWLYRLPTESEWEYACRAGTTTAFHYGSALVSGMANFNGQYGYDASLGESYNARGIYLFNTTAVGSYQPNAWGLYDMHGNVWEWCRDWYGDYPAGSVTDPQGPPSGSTRVLRGGGWDSYGRLCRSAQRLSQNPALRTSALGLRVVLALGQP